MENLIDDLKKLVDKYSTSLPENLLEIKFAINKIEKRNKVNQALSVIENDLEKNVLRKIILCPFKSKYSAVNALSENENYKNKTISEYMEIINFIYKKHKKIVDQFSNY